MVGSAKKRKDFWDKLSSITPLVLGVAITGVGAAFTHIYNFRQLQLNQITALEKLRPLLTSNKPEEREFGYASFVALGYEDVAVRIIQINKDQSGRPVLVELKKSAVSPQLQANATDALKSLDEAKALLNKLEYGDTRGLDSWIEKGDKIAAEFGLKTKLARALIASEVVWGGVTRPRKLAAATSSQLGGSPASGIDEKLWVAKYLDVMIENRGPLPKTVVERRVKEFKGLIEKGDWELTAYQPSPPSPSPEAAPKGKAP